MIIGSCSRPRAASACSSAQGWARWFTICIVCLNFIAQLGFLGNSQYPVWSLSVMALNVRFIWPERALKREHVRPSGRPLTNTRTEAVAQCGARRPAVEPVGSSRAGNVRAWRRHACRGEPGQPEAHFRAAGAGCRCSIGIVVATFALVLPMSADYRDV